MRRNMNERTQSVCGVDDEEEHRKASAMPDRGLHIDLASLADENVVEVRKDLLSAKRLSRAHGRNNLFRE